MNRRPPDVSSDADAPDRRKTQRFASFTLYAAMVVLAVWVIRDFVPAIAWAGVIAIALWPLYKRIADRGVLKGRTTWIAVRSQRNSRPNHTHAAAEIPRIYRQRFPQDFGG